MKALILKDKLIPKDEALALLDEYGEFIKNTIGVDCEWFVENKDFSEVPTVADADGDLKPTYQYRQALASDVHKRYRDYGVDTIVMWVHEDNFLFKGVWGVAWSYVHFKYNFLLCRWDKDNSVNTFNVLFHEDRHPDDRLIKKETGVDIHEEIKQWILENGNAKDKAYVRENDFNWDRDYVHGALPSVQYIGRSGYKLSESNLALFKLVGPHLAKAYAERKRKHTQNRVKLLKTVVLLASRVVELLRLGKNKEDKIPKK